MATANVIPLADRERAGSGARLLSEGQEKLVGLIVAWLEGLRPAVQEELFVLADSTSDRLQQTRYFDLRRAIEREWDCVVQGFSRAMNAAPASADQAAAPFDFSALSLVEDEELSERIVIREFAAQLCETCDEELYFLNRRVAFLQGVTDPAEGESNPLSPLRICQSLNEACRALAEEEKNPALRLVLLRRLERHLHLALPAVYHDINQHLIGRRVLPDLTRSYRRSGAAGGGAVASGDMLGALQRLAQARSGGGTALPATAAIPVAPAGAVPVPAGQAWPAGMQPAVAGTDFPAGMTPVFLASLNQLQHTVELPPVVTGDGNLIRQVRDSEAARQVGSLEAVTIDIVAMLFDFIFDAKDVPAAVKSLVGRLQIPVLKIALMDAGFFSRREHPVRRFLDEISGISQAWGDDVAENDPFYCKLQQLVERIQQEFETDAVVFSAAIDELEAFVAEHEARQEEALLAVTRSVEQRELAAVAKEVAQSRAQQRAETAFVIWQKEQGDTALPLLKAFYASYWRQVLERCALDHPGDAIEDQTPWQEKVAVMNDLAWSVIPKTVQEERMRLISMLPTLLARLNAGLDSIHLGSEIRRQFFDTLVLLHSAALRNQTPPPAVLDSVPEALDAPAEEAPTVETPGEVVVTRSSAEGVEMEDVILACHSPTWCGNDPLLMREVGLLKRGDWVEFFDDQGGAQRERLNWVSPQRGIMVFSNHGAAKAISISPEALAHMLKEGRARLVARESLFERALENAVSALDSAA